MNMVSIEGLFGMFLEKCLLKSLLERYSEKEMEYLCRFDVNSLRAKND